MRDIIENKEIKVNEKNIIPLAEVKEESDVTLNLELYKNNIPFDVTGQSIKLGLLINGEIIGEQSDGITINKNIVTIKLKNSFIQPGKLELDLTLTDNTGRMTTSSFYLIVNKKTISGTSIQGTDLLETLDKVVLYFKVNSQKAIDGFIAESTELLSDIKKNCEKTINDIKSNYDSLKQIIIDENQAANLQEQININKNKIEQLEDLTPVWQEYEGVGNITVNDSFDGITKDFVIKGRTLSNLLNNKNIEFDSVNNRLAIKNSENKSLFANKTYTLFNLSNKTIGYTIDRISNNSYIRGVDVSANTISVVSLNEDEYISIIFGAVKDGWENSEDSKNQLKQSCVILEGSYNCNPFNSHFDSIASTGEQEDNKIKIKSVGKNLFEPNYFNENAEVGNITRKLKYKLNPNTKYTCSSNIPKADGKPATVYFNGISSDTNGVFLNTPKTFTSNSLGEIDLLIRVNGESGFTIQDFINGNMWIQLEENSIATNYEQFRSKLFEIPLPFEGGLKSLPNGISDEIYDNGKLIQKIEKRVYKTGDELLPNVITDKKNTIVELSEYKTYDINPFFLRTFNKITHLYQENNICGEVSFEIVKDRDAIINGNTESIIKLNKISESHIEESKKKNNELQQNIDSNSVSIRGIETKIKNFVTLEELGAVGNGVADDLPALNKAMELMLQNKIKKVVGNGVYAISNSFHINNKNDITFEIDTIVPTNNFPRNSSLIVIGQSSVGSTANITLKTNLLDGKNIANGLNIFSCGSSLFDIKTAINMSKFVNIYNPSKICSDNKFTGNNVRQCGFGFIIKSEEQSACEGTIIDYNFIYDCKYAGILLDRGSHYTDIRSALDFNGKCSLILELNSVSGINVGDTLNIGDETITVVSIYGNFIYCISNKNVDKGKTAFKKDVSIPSTGKTIKSVITTNSDQNVFLDIINANNKAGFSRNIITSQYCGGIYGDKNSINTDFVVSYRTGQNENINIQGLEVATNSESVRLIEGRTGNNLFNYKSQEKVIELNNVQISGSRQNNVLPAGASDHPVASVQDLLDGLYSVNVIAQGRVDYVYQGLLVKYSSSKSITKIASVNVDLKVDETGTIKATNGSGSLSPTIAIYFTRLASY